MIDKKRKKTYPWFYVVIGFTALFLATLACENELEPVNLTAIAPQDLSGRDLSWRAMGRVDFSGKDMRGVILTGARMWETNFTNADLRDADLSDAWAEGAIFDGADLRGARLDRLCIEGASWENAKLDSRWLEVVTILVPKLKPNQDLHGLDLSGLCMYSYDLRNVNLNAANLSNSMLAWVDFTGANLQSANLTDARLGATNFAKANLEDAIVEIDQLSDSLLCETIMPDGQISNDGCHLLSEPPTPLQ